MQYVYLSPWQEFPYGGPIKDPKGRKKNKPSYRRQSLGKIKVNNNRLGIYEVKFYIELIWDYDKQCYADGQWLDDMIYWPSDYVVGKSAKHTMKRIDERFLNQPVNSWINEHDLVTFVSLSQKRWDNLHLLI